MQHPLDNPIWNALVSGNAHLSVGTERVKFFDTGVSPFAAVPENSNKYLEELYNESNEGRVVLLWSKEKLAFSKQWQLLDWLPGLQMVCAARPVQQLSPSIELIKLSAADIPQMLELTKLTRPGPFNTRTIEFGNYEGIFDGDKLVAMTGRRMHCYDYIEISAVCTHPGYLGKGYAKQLLLSQAIQIFDDGCTPFLHVRSDNERAIGVYHSLGFEKRLDVFFYVLKKNIV